MANVIPTRPRFALQRRNFAVVASLYNEAFVRPLLENFERELNAIVPNAGITVFEAPGAFEIPLIVQEIAQAGGFEAIVALGVVMQGATPHAEYIGRAVTDALLNISLRFRLPVVQEILIVRDEQQARERCIDPELNRGIEAARAVTRALQTLARFRER